VKSQDPHSALRLMLKLLIGTHSASTRLLLLLTKFRGTKTCVNKGHKRKKKQSISSGFNIFFNEESTEG
jgi:hypothetical protein